MCGAVTLGGVCVVQSHEVVCVWCSHIRWCVCGAVTLGGVCMVQSH